MYQKLFHFAMNFLVLLVCFPIHECAHALVAKQLGDDTAYRQGRMTLNPFAHIDLIGMLCMIFLGFGWAQPVPINADNFKHKKLGFALSALAGPVSNLLLAFISIMAAKIFAASYYATGSGYWSFLRDMFYYIMVVNLSLALFNLLPVPPLDGSRIYAAMLPESTYFKIMQYENIFFIALIILSFAGLLDKPLNAMQNSAIMSMNYLTGWLDDLLIKAFKL